MDDYGDYGIVGYLHAEQREGTWVIEDFVMSCRVAQKRVEEALFTHLSNVLSDQGLPLKIQCVQTERNGPIINKLSTLGASDENGWVVLNRNLPGSDVVEVIYDSE